MDRKDALIIVNQYIKNPNLINHMLAVEAAMRYYAKKNKQDEELWGITGILHDFDWEIHPTAENHPMAGAPILRSHGVPEDVIKAILGHSNSSNVPRDTLMAQALYACDEITGLITAVALVRPSRSLHDLSVKSIKKKWKDKAFAAGANRQEIEESASEFGIELWEHVANVIEAMRVIAKDIGLDGNLTTSETEQ